MNKKQVEMKIANAILEKLEKVITNQKVQKHEFIKISEAKVSELEKEIVAKGVDQSQNSTNPKIQTSSTSAGESTSSS